jgi:transcriptional regulator with XRE-family HTH domain
VDNRSEVREFLASRRARLTPEQAGLPDYGGGKRRVPGLRREEAALLAGVSIDYYVRLERGNLNGVSESVLDSLARALQLDEAERAHLFDLARTASKPARPPRSTGQQRIRPSVRRVIDSVSTPAYIRNGRLDMLAVNKLAAALFSLLLDGNELPVNAARFMFLDPRGLEFYRNWETTANSAVAILRSEAGRNPYDRKLTDLVGELSTRSEDFRTRWATHDVRLHRTGTKHYHHPVAGDLDLTFEALELPADTGLTILTYTAEPDTPSEEALNFLASWANAEVKYGV